MFKIAKRVLWVGLALSLAGCSGQGFLSGQPQASSTPLIVAVAPPGSTVTPTPFQPQPPTPTYLPTSYPTSTPTLIPFTPTRPPAEFTAGEAKSWADYPGPTIWPDITVPAPAGILAQPEGQVNILLLGSDQRPGEGGFRTDTIMLLTINPVDATVSLTSFPRDLYVYIPGWTVNRINTAFGYGGFDALALTMEYNFGVRPNYYILIHLSVFEEVVDSLGGLEVEVGKDMCDHRDNYGEYCASQGTRWMDGETALWYVRSRYTTSDFDRGRRQQEVVQAGFERLITLDAVQRAPELYQIYQENFITNMTLAEATPLLPLAMEVYQNNAVEHYYIGPQQVYDWINYGGSQVLVPLRESVLEVMRSALNSPHE